MTETLTWPEVELGDVIELFDSKRIPLSGKERNTRQGKYPYFGASGIIDYIDDYIFDGEYLLVAEDGENLNSRKLPIAFWGKGKFWVNNHAHILRGKKGLANTDFIKHWLLQANISGYITGAAQPKLNQANLCRIKLALPSIETQSAIAEKLSNYDDLIENNNRRIVILEDMAQSLYREWFVHFRYPGHKDNLDTEGNPKLVDSPLGQIPEGWEVKTAAEAIMINPRTKLAKDGEKPFVGMSGLSESSMVINDIIEKSGNSGAKFINGDTLFARITPCLQNGKTGYVQFLNEEQPVGFGSTEFIVLRKSEELSSEYIYLLSRSNNFREHAIKSMTGATGRQRVHPESFASYYLAVPPKDLMTEFTKLAKPMFKSIYNLSLRNENLKQQRDMLLPKLISGQIELKE
jgi:type I restriction enzyme S subunit